MSRLRFWIIFVHRYLGIALSLLFVGWFISGIAMIYARDMPRLTPGVRLQHLAPIDFARVRLSATEAAVRAAPRGPGPPPLPLPPHRPASLFGARRPPVFPNPGDTLEAVDERVT